jgi:hypothetical protein
LNNFMPDYFNSPSPSDTMAQSVAPGVGQISSFIAALPQLSASRARMQQYLALQRAQQILRDAQTKEAQSRVGYYDAQTDHSRALTGQVQQKTAQAGAMQGVAEQGGMASMLGNMVQGAPAAIEGQAIPQPLMSAPMQEAMQSGIMPSQGGQFTKDDLVNYLRSKAQGAATQNAMTSPAGAAGLMQNRNTPPDNVGQNSLGGNTVVGLPSARTIPANSVLSRGGGQPMELGATSVNRGGMVQMPGQEAVVGQAFPPPVSHNANSAAIATAFKNLDPDTRQKMGPEIIGALMQLAGMTNSIGGGGGQPAPSSATPSQPKSQAEYIALPSGSLYIDTDGSTKRKK